MSYCIEIKMNKKIGREITPDHFKTRRINKNILYSNFISCFIFSFVYSFKSSVKRSFLKFTKKNDYIGNKPLLYQSLSWRLELRKIFLIHCHFRLVKKGLLYLLYVLNIDYGN